MRKCELCNSVARMYCESDRAILCWDACQAPTPWTGSGSRLGPTVSVCETCVHTGISKDDDNTNNDDSDDDDDNLETEDEDEDNNDDSRDGNNDGGGGGEDEGNDQVVPLSFTPPPLASSSSSSQESSGRALKKMETERLDLSQAHGNNTEAQLRLWVSFTDSLSRSCIKNMIKRNMKAI